MNNPINQLLIRWRVRRRIIVATLLFCACAISYLLWRGADTELNRSIANGLILLATSVIGSYIFGSAWDDKNQDKKD